LTSALPVTDTNESIRYSKTNYLPVALDERLILIRR
jgi:hypothetical protein